MSLAPPPPSKENGYAAIPLPLPNQLPPPLRPFQKLPKKPRALEILTRLKLMYPAAPCSLDYESPMQLMVATMLAAQCTDARVNKVTPALFGRFPDAAAFAAAELTELEERVRSTGFYRNKAKNIQAAARKIIADFGGQVPSTLADLTTLPGVARKTANVVLAHAFDIHEGVTVDTHVKRISGLLGLTKQTEPVKIEQDLMKLLPQADWENWSIRLVYHGRAICVARSPKCLQCDLLDICPGAAKIRAEAAKVAKFKTAKAEAAKAKTAKVKTAKAKKRFTKPLGTV
ncbi:MAG: endonuclease III [Phormidesmis priestleyi]|uniref:Endonuclease III n=1 Tax=Phormidesmis priestleyi TaxID=268141 RepID=A0A2W4X2E0_9CYAN|nr:MAG: endonuclease III [Phormidesmis priestleyi]